MAGKASGLLADTPEPDEDPYVPEGSVEEVINPLPCNQSKSQRVMIVTTH